MSYYKDDFVDIQFSDSFELSPDMLEGISGGTNTWMSKKVFGALIKACKKEGKSKEELADYFMTAEALYNVKGMEGVTPDDAMAYLDEYWDKY